MFIPCSEDPASCKEKKSDSNTFVLSYYFVATYFGPSAPSSGHTGAVSEVKLYVKLQLKVHKIKLHKYIKFLVNIKICAVNTLKNVHI
jgi:hypothetical protein